MRCAQDTPLENNILQFATHIWIPITSHFCTQPQDSWNMHSMNKYRNLNFIQFRANAKYMLFVHIFIEASFNLCLINIFQRSYTTSHRIEYTYRNKTNPIIISQLRRIFIFAFSVYFLAYLVPFNTDQCVSITYCWANNIRLLRAIHRNELWRETKLSLHHLLCTVRSVKTWIVCVYNYNTRQDDRDYFILLWAW